MIEVDKNLHTTIAKVDQQEEQCWIDAGSWSHQ